MAGDTAITIIGNLVADPELRFTPSGAAVANFTVASTPRAFDKQANEWKDGETLFLRCSVWREAAENVAETLQKGMRVIVNGTLKSRSFDTKEGEKRTVMEIDVEDVGPSLKFASAKVNRNARGGQQGGGQQGGGFGGGQQNGGFGGGQQQPQGGGGFGGGDWNGGGQQQQPQGGGQQAGGAVDPWGGDGGGFGSGGGGQQGGGFGNPGGTWG